MTNNRFATCLRFARMTAVKTGENVSVLALPNGRFRAIFTVDALCYDLGEFITVTINPNNGERLGQ